MSERRRGLSPIALAAPAVAGSRWGRLRPVDAGDGGALVLVFVGLLLTATSVAGATGAGLGVLAVVVAPLLALHASCPVFALVGSALFLTRRGRTIGRTRRWVWAGVVASVPLWFLLGGGVAVRGAGQVTWIVWMWNLACFGLMGIGVRRTLAA